MAGHLSWGTPDDFAALLRQTEKRLIREERRPSGDIYVGGSYVEELATPSVVTAIEYALAANRTFRQASAPTTTAEYELRAGDVWFDTDDGNHMYTWSGSAWQDAKDTQIAESAAAAAAAQADADQALVDAAAAVTTAGNAQTTANAAQTSAGNALTQANAAMTASDNIANLSTTIQSTTTASRGIKFNSTALIAYDSVSGSPTLGQPTFSLTTATGAVAMKGSLTSGSTITGAVITGGTVQTEDNGAGTPRGIKMNSAGLTAYDSAGSPVLAFVSATGALTVKGTIQSGSLISGATVRGGTVETSETNPAVRLTTGGLYLFDAASAATLTMNAATGALTLKGSIQSGSAIDGATITGGTVQTEATGVDGIPKGIKINSTGLTAYNASGTPTVTIDAATGTMSAVNATVTGVIRTADAATYPRAELVDSTRYFSASYSVPTTNSGVFRVFTQSDLDKPAVVEAIGATMLISPSYSTNSAVNTRTRKPEILLRAGVYQDAATNPALIHLSGDQVLCGATLTMSTNNIENCNNVSCTSVSAGSITTTGAVSVGGNLGVVGNSVQFDALADGGAANSNSGTKYVRANATGRIYSSTTAPSSRTIKHDIQPLAIDPEALLSLDPKSFRYNDSPDQVRVGVIAEDAHDLGLGILVGYEDRENPERPTGFDYDGLSVALLGVVRRQNERIARLEAAMV